MRGMGDNADDERRVKSILRHALVSELLGKVSAADAFPVHTHDGQYRFYWAESCCDSSETSVNRDQHVTLN